MLRGVRGSTTVERDDAAEIAEAVRELLVFMQQENAFRTEDIGAVIFSSTPDLTAAFPAAGARQMGDEWTAVPLFGTMEIEHTGAPIRCIRVLLLWNTEKSQGEIRPVYLRGAAVLRPDLVRRK